MYGFSLQHIEKQYEKLKTKQDKTEYLKRALADAELAESEFEANHTAMGISETYLPEYSRRERSRIIAVKKWAERQLRYQDAVQNISNSTESTAESSETPQRQIRKIHWYGSDGQLVSLIEGLIDLRVLEEDHHFQFIVQHFYNHVSKENYTFSNLKSDMLVPDESSELSRRPINKIYWWGTEGELVTLIQILLKKNLLDEDNRNKFVAEHFFNGELNQHYKAINLKSARPTDESKGTKSEKNEAIFQLVLSITEPPENN